MAKKNSQDGDVSKQSEQIEQNKLESAQQETLVTAQDPAPMDDAEMMRQLVKVQFQREARAAAEEEQKRQAVEAKRRQRDISAQSEIKGVLESQARCRHLKGGKSRTNNQKEDYNLSIHTFIDGPKSTRVKCLSCRMKWMKGDTAEYLLRHGKKIPNHTGIGWKDGTPSVMYMLQHTTNTITKSEVPLDDLQNAVGVDDSVDSSRPTYSYEI